MTKKPQDLPKHFLVFMAIGCLVAGFAYMFLVTFVGVPDTSMRFADTILGFMLGTVVTTIISYFFGSSKGSSDKNKTIENIKS